MQILPSRRVQHPHLVFSTYWQPRAVSMPITLYMAHPSSPSRAVLMCCRAIELDVKVHLIDLKQNEQLQDWFIKMNPHHTVPTIDDNGFYLWESRAILRYISAKFARDDSLYPADLRERALVDRMLDFDMTLAKAAGQYLAPRLFMPESLVNNDPSVEEKLRRYLAEAENCTTLAEGKYAAGEQLTIADFSLMEILNQLYIIDFDFSPYANLMAWRDKMTQLPYYEECHTEFEKFKAFTKTDNFKEIMAKRAAKE